MNRYTPVKDIIVGDKVYIQKMKSYILVDSIHSLYSKKNDDFYIVFIHSKGQIRFRKHAVVVKYIERPHIDTVRISKKYIKLIQEKKNENPIDVGARLVEYFKMIQAYKNKDNVLQ